MVIKWIGSEIFGDEKYNISAGYYEFKKIN